MLRVGLIGLGDVSSIHINAIQRSAYGELVAVCDQNPEIKERVLDVPFFTEIDEMLEEIDLDVVHICLPHNLHARVTKQCIQKNVHVFLEKPVALNYDESIKQLELEQETSQKIGVCFQNRYNASFLKLREILETEDVGKVTAIKGLVTWYRPEGYYSVKPWRGLKAQAGYGTIINQSIHTLDLLQLLGGELESCKASLSQLLDYDVEVEDTASAVFTFRSGVKGYFHATNAFTDNSSVELQVITEKTKLTIKDNRLYYTNQLGEKVVVAEDEALDGAKAYYGTGHAQLINRFYKSVIEDTTDYVTVAEAIPSMAMIELMDRSSGDNCRSRTVRMEELSDGKGENWRTSHDVKERI